MNPVHEFYARYGLVWRPEKGKNKTIEQIIREEGGYGKIKVFCPTGYNNIDNILEELVNNCGDLSIKDINLFVETFKLDEKYKSLPNWVSQLLFFYYSMESGEINFDKQNKNLIQRRVIMLAEESGREFLNNFPEYQVKVIFNEQEANRFLGEELDKWLVDICDKVRKSKEFYKLQKEQERILLDYEKQIYTTEALAK